MELLTELSKSGVSYLLLSISIFAIVKLFNLLVAEKEARRLDAERVRDSIAEPLRELKRLMEMTFDKVNKDDN